MNVDAILELWPWALVATVLLYLLLAWLFPALLRPLFSLLIHIVYRFHVFHANRVPATGSVLILSNHVSYIDWLLLWVAAPRKVTFVLWSGFFKNPFLRFLLSYSRHRTIAIDNAKGRPHAAMEGLKKVIQALEAGEAVVVFPEQTLSRNGQMLPWGRGIELVLKKVKVSVPVVPVHLDNLWGSIFSWAGGKVVLKWPKDCRRRIAVYFGEPLPSSTTSAEARAAVQECQAECAIRMSDYLLPGPREFVRNAARWRNMFRPAYVDLATGTERKLTWGRTLVGVWCISRWLRKQLGSEATVGVWLPTSLGSLMANLGLSFLRKTSVNLNYTAGIDGVLSAVRQAEIKTVITSKRFVDRVPLELPSEIRLIYLEDALASISNRQRLICFLTVLLCPVWILDRCILRLNNQIDDLVTILFSSGSTGEPKGVMLTHRNIVANAKGLIEALQLQPNDRILATLPFFHTFGYTVCLWAPAIAPLEAVFFPDPRQAKEVGENCRKYHCTIMLGTATFVRFYLRRSGPEDFKSVRLLVCGAEKLPVKLAEEFCEKFGVLPLEGYGCTELSPVVSVNLHDVELGGLKQQANRMGTVGQAIPGVVAKAFDPETFAPLGPETEGVIAAKGPNVMVGYLHQPEKTQQVIRNGWYITGDIGHIEEDGFIRITGRISRFAKIGGEMIPLERLDDEMHELLATGGERVLAVAAAPDEKRGERIIVLHLATVADKFDWLFEQLRERGMPNLWIPDRRDCYLVESFPVLGSGKLDLRRVGELAKELAAKKA